jgi:hypothetical protein
MAGGTHSQGAFGKFIIEPGASPHTFDASSLRFEILHENIRKVGRHGGDNGIRGTLSHASERIRALPGYFYGPVTMYVTPNSLDALLINCLGFTEVTNVFTVSDTLPYFGILIDREEEQWEYSDCMVASWYIRGRAGQHGEMGEPELLQLTMNIIACSEDNTTTWPSPEPTLGVTALSDGAYIFSDSDSGITLSGAARAIEEMIFHVNHFAFPKYANSLSAHSIRPRDRLVQSRFRLPYNSDNAGLYGQAVGGAAATLAFTNSTVSAQFDLAKFQVPDNSPTISRGKNQISLVVDGVARMDGTTKELIITNDNTP